MNLRRTFCCLLVLWIFSVTAAVAADAENLLSSLRQGGHIIYFRHAQTDWAQPDQDRSDLSNCATQRNLSEQGRAQSRLIGEGFRQQRIPLGQVLSSAYCRCFKMAELAFGRYQISSMVTSVYTLSAEVKTLRTEALLELFATPPQAGTNTVITSHQANFLAAKNIALVEGEAAIVRPDGEGGSEMVARVLPDEWLELR